MAGHHAPTSATAAVGSIPAGQESAVVVDATGMEALTIVTVGLAAGLSVEVRLLDATGAEIATLTPITTNTVTAFSIGWARLKIVRKNASAGAASFAAHFALR